MSSYRLITLTALIALLVSAGFHRPAHADGAACVADDIIAPADPGCPASGDYCSITQIFTVASGCVLDFGTRNVTIESDGRLVIGAGEAGVTLRAGDFTVAPGGFIDGRTEHVVANFTVEAAGNISVEKLGTGVENTGRIRVSGKTEGGILVLNAGGNIFISGQLHSNNRGIGAAAGGTIKLVAVGDIVTTSTSEIDVHGAPQAGGGSVDMYAGGLIDTGKSIDATGGEGGSITLDADGKIVIRDKLNTTGTGDGGSGGDIYILAELDVEVNGQIVNRGTGSPTGLGGGDGGTVTIKSGFGDVIVRNELNVQAGYPDGGGGDIEISAFGSIDIQSAARIIAGGSGIDSYGGEITLTAGLDVTVDGQVLVSGGDSGGDITVDAGRHVTLSDVTEARSTTAGSLGGGSVDIEAGKDAPGNVTIAGEGEIDLRGGGCDVELGCSLGGNADIAACDITVGGQGIDTSAPGNDGEGGDITLSARGQLTISSVLDATGEGVAGRNIFIYASETPPDIIPPGRVTPPAETTACCAEPGDPSCDDSSCAGVCMAHCTLLCHCDEEGTIDQFEQCDGGVGCGVGEVCAPPGSDKECLCIDTCGTMAGIQPGEDCDGSDLGGETCVSRGFLGGDKPGEGLGCTADCRFDFGGCVPKCGDGFVEPEEECDTNRTVEEECTDVGFFGGGPLACLEDCTSYDTSACDDGECGDGFLCAVPGCTGGPGGGPEECDDGNSSNDDSCLADCSRAWCGDGEVCTGSECTTSPDGGAEECDDGNKDDNDACLSDCRAAFCGDGIVCSAASCTSGPGGGPEECERDGNACCLSEGCVLRSCNGTTCSSAGGFCCPPGWEATCDDGNPCTDDGCNPASGCVHTSNSASCDDGDACTTNDTCSGGACVGGPALDCDDGNICTYNVCDEMEGCREPVPNPAACPLHLLGAKKLTVKVKPANARKNKLVFLSKGRFQPPSLDDHPTTAGAILRVRDSAGQDKEFPLPAGKLWKAKGSKGFVYKDPKRTKGPCTKVTFKTGKLIKAVCKGDQIEMILPLSEPVQVILRMGNTSYCSVFGGSTKNKADLFVAKAAQGSLDCSAAFFEPGFVPEGY